MLGAATAIFLHFLISAMQADGIADALDLPARIYWIGLVIAVFSTLIPSFFMNSAIGRIGAQRVAMLGMIGPLATIVAAILVLGEPFGLWDGIGTAITLAGIALYMKSVPTFVPITTAGTASAKTHIGGRSANPSA